MKSLEERRAERKADEKERLKLEQAQILGGNAPGDDGSEEGLDKTAAGKGEGPVGKANADAAKQAGKQSGSTDDKAKAEAEAKAKAGGAAGGNGGGSGFTGRNQS